MCCAKQDWQVRRAGVRWWNVSGGPAKLCGGGARWGESGVEIRGGRYSIVVLEAVNLVCSPRNADLLCDRLVNVIQL